MAGAVGIELRPLRAFKEDLPLCSTVPTDGHVRGELGSTNRHGLYRPLKCAPASASVLSCFKTRQSEASNMSQIAMSILPAEYGYSPYGHLSLMVPGALVIEGLVTELPECINRTRGVSERAQSRARRHLLRDFVFRSREIN